MTYTNINSISFNLQNKYIVIVNYGNLPKYFKTHKSNIYFYLTSKAGEYIDFCFSKEIMADSSNIKGEIAKLMENIIAENTFDKYIQTYERILSYICKGIDGYENSHFN